MGELKEIGDGYLYLQPNNVNAVIKISFDKNLSVEKLIYNPAWVENGQSLFSSSNYKISLPLKDLHLGDVLYIDNFIEDAEGYLAKEILIVGYDEIAIPKF